MQQSFVGNYVYYLEFLNSEPFNILCAQTSNAVPSWGGSSNDVLSGRVSYVWTLLLPATHNLNLFGQWRLKPFVTTHTPTFSSRRTCGSQEILISKPQPTVMRAKKLCQPGNTELIAIIDIVWFPQTPGYWRTLQYRP